MVGKGNSSVNSDAWDWIMVGGPLLPEADSCGPKLEVKAGSLLVDSIPGDVAAVHVFEQSVLMFT